MSAFLISLHSHRAPIVWTELYWIRADERLPNRTDQEVCLRGPGRPSYKTNKNDRLCCSLKPQNSAMSTPSVALNPVLSPSTSSRHSVVPLNWDIRSSPRNAVFATSTVTSPSEFARPATYPPVRKLRVVSGLIPTSWRVTVSNPTGVTVWDVLVAIYMALQTPLTQFEWACKSEKERARIERAYHSRCLASSNVEHSQRRGVRRIDCFLSTTVFAGLSSPTFRHGRLEVVLTLSRHFGERHGH